MVYDTARCERGAGVIGGGPGESKSGRAAALSDEICE